MPAGGVLPRLNGTILTSRTNAAISVEIAWVRHVFPLILACTFLAETAFAQTPPLPRERPAQAPSAGPEPDAPARPEAAEAEPSVCRQRIADVIAVVAAEPPLAGPNGCGAADVVKLEAVILKDKTRVAVKPPATLQCGMAEAVATWLREDVTAAVAGLGAGLRTLDNYASFECRTRNRAPGAKLSEHGLANAIDIRGFALSNGKFAALTDRNVPKDFRETVKKSVCAHFTTVLGPGSDGHHETHIHLDLAQRRGGYRLCQWDVLEPGSEVPLPRPRPADAPALAGKEP